MIDPTASQQAPKVMFYCHDTYGLGHLRRTLTLANHLRATMPNMSQLIVTGSPVAQSFPYPDGADYVKLPSVTKNGNGEYESRSIATSFQVIRDMRQDILLSAARHFQPDVFIVDHAPAGLKGEAIATLRWLKKHSPRTKLVVGLRDVMDEAHKVRQSWAREGVYQLLDDIYDTIIVYGHRDFYDVTKEYGLSARAAAKTRFVGYLGREAGVRTADEIRATLNMTTDKLVVVTAGGGGDGKDLFQSVLEGLRRETHLVGFDCLLVGGPLMAAADRASLREQISDRGHIHFLDFAEDMASYLTAADIVVSMGGYNSVCEILSLNRPAIIVPRVHPRKEQLIRADFLSRRGLIHMIHPDDLSPRRMLAATLGILADSASPVPHLEMDGLMGFTTALRALLPRPQTQPVAEPAAAFGRRVAAQPVVAY